MDTLGEYGLLVYCDHMRFLSRAFQQYHTSADIRHGVIYLFAVCLVGEKLNSLAEVFKLTGYATSPPPHPQYIQRVYSSIPKDPTSERQR